MTDTGAQAATKNEDDWPANYFNYFTEVEERFQQARGTGLFLLSPLDWALIESWKAAAVPLSAVLQGIDDAFAKWHGRKQKGRAVNSLAYCAQAVAATAARAPQSAHREATAGEASFAEEEVRNHLDEGVRTLRARPEPAFHPIADTLRAIAAELPTLLRRLEDLERRLTAVEDRMIACARTLLSDDDLYRIRLALDMELKPYRGKMTAEQLTALEHRYLDAAMLRRFNLPRLSLFHLH